jgi:hypothetical protein
MVIEKTKKKISAESFFKTLINLSRFFSKIMRYVFIWVFLDFLDTLYTLYMGMKISSKTPDHRA